MAKLEGEGITRTEIISVEVDRLELEPGLNLRDDLGDLNELAASIQANGIRVPLLVKGTLGESGKVIIVDGHRRFKALIAANRNGAAIKRVPCMVENKGTSPEDRIINQFICNSGKPLDALEEAKGIALLVQKGWQMKEIGAKLGKSDQWVSNRLALNSAPASVKASVAKGQTTISAATQIARADNPEKVAEAATKQATKRAEKKAKKDGAEEPQAPAKVKAKDVAEAKEPDATKPMKITPSQVVKIIKTINAGIKKETDAGNGQKADGLLVAKQIILDELGWKE